MRTWSELLLIEDADRAVGHQLPMRVAVAAANHVSDPPRLVIVHWCGRVRREAGEHQGEAIRIGLQNREGRLASVEGLHLGVQDKALLARGFCEQPAHRVEACLVDPARQELPSARHEVCNHALRICDR